MPSSVRGIGTGLVSTVALVAAALITLLSPAPVQASFSSFCAQFPYNECESPLPRDLLFVVDVSGSMNLTSIRGPVIDYTQQLYCSFDRTIGSKVGLITFGYNVQVRIPLESRSSDDWAATVDAIRNTLDNNPVGGVTANTPTAEALEVAYRELELRGTPGNVKIVVVMTDGVPNPVPIAYQPDFVPSLWAEPYADQYYASFQCDPGSGPDCAVTINKYLQHKVPESAALVKSTGAILMMLAVPSAAQALPDTRYFAGTPANIGGCGTGSDPECIGTCNYCDLYLPPFGGTASCKCATLTSSIVSDPLTDIFTSADYNVTRMVITTQTGACQLPPPTKSPTPRGYTYSPSQTPTTSKPSKAPTTSKPSKAPTRIPTMRPSFAPTTSRPSKAPTTSTPSKSPTTSRPSQSPSKSPSRSPTTSKPSLSPTTSRPSNAPTTSKPSMAPTTSKPSKAPTTSRPSFSPSKSPSKAPTTSSPTLSPTTRPSRTPTTSRPSRSPTTSRPSRAPSTSKPSNAPSTSRPSHTPTRSPSRAPTTSKPSFAPTSSRPTWSPSTTPTKSPTTSKPTSSPTTSRPSRAPTTSKPTFSPSRTPSRTPTTSKPSAAPTTSRPSAAPTTTKPSIAPTTSKPSQAPTTSKPSFSPSRTPTTSKPSLTPTTSKPSRAPTTSRPSKAPTTSKPSHAPTVSPSFSPTTSRPSATPTTSRPSKVPTTSKPSLTPTTSTPTASPTRSCIKYTVTSCPEGLHRDVVFVLDRSRSTAPEQIALMREFAKSFICYYPSVNRAGIIAYGEDVRVVVPIAHRDPEQWMNAVDGINPDYLTSNTGFSPLVEALEVARRELGQLSNPIAKFPLVIVLATSQPQPVPIAQYDLVNNVPSPWMPPWADRYYGSIVCNDAYNKTCTRAVTLIRYLGELMKAAVNDLTTFQSTTLNLMLLPNRNGELPPSNYFAGTPATLCSQTSSTCFSPPNACDFCTNYFVAGGEGVTTECRCVNANNEPIYSGNFASFTSFNLTEMVAAFANDACATAAPTGSPTVSPSTSPSAAPTTSRPSKAPSTSRPSHAPSRSPSGTPSKAPTTSKPSRAPSGTPTSSRTSSPTMSPSNSPSTSRPSHGPSNSPSMTPSTSKPSHSPSNSPSMTPSTSKPSHSPSNSPSTAPSKTPTTSKPSWAPSLSPSTSRPSSSPSQSPTTSTPSLSPTTSKPSTSPSNAPSTSRPSSAPSQAPTCYKPAQMDIFWIMDGSSSMAPQDEWSEDRFGYLKQFIVDFTDTVAMSSVSVRQGFLTYGGLSYDDEGNFQGGTVIGSHLSIDTTAASDAAMFKAAVAALEPVGITTNTPAAINYVRTNMMTPGNERDGAFRVVILGTDGYPSWFNGQPNDTMVEESEYAATLMRDEDNVVFIFLRIGDDYPDNWFRNISTHIYEVASFAELEKLLTGRDAFLCLPLTHRPSKAPTTSPSSSPSLSPSTSLPSTTPTVSPTTSSPSFGPSVAPSTSKPSVSPSQAPSTSRPSTSPSGTPTTSQPSMSPSTSPSRAPTTSSPSSAPSVAPSQAPTPCTPAVVQCCVTVNQQLIQVYVNEVDVTSTVSPTSAFGSRQVTKHFSFLEPMGPVAIAIKGFENTEGPVGNNIAGLALRCTSSRADSAWNIDSLANSEWRAVLSTASTTDQVPSSFYVNEYTGASSPVVPYTGTDLKLNAASPYCDSPNIDQTPALRTQSAANPRYFAFRRVVNGTTPPCPTHSPTSSPSLSPSTSRPSIAPSTTPTLSPSIAPTTSIPTTSPSKTPSNAPSNVPSSTPTTSRPSLSPSASPTTTKPSLSPSHVPTFSPSGSPSTSRPSLSPSSGPSVSPSTSMPSNAPSTQPTSSPSTSNPSSAPSVAPSQAPTPCTPAVVQCCVTVNQQLLQVFVNEVDVTSTVTPTTSFSNRNVMKQFSFLEPLGLASIAIKGFENTEGLIGNNVAGLGIRCTSSRPSSAWNIDSSADSGWRAVLSTSSTADQVPANYFVNDYAGTTSNVVNYTGTDFKMTASSPNCNFDDMARTPLLRTQTSANPRYFAFRRVINETYPGCPTQSPSQQPSVHPSTSTPSASPSLSPSTSHPSTSPGTWAPSLAPLSSMPSSSPSSSPSTSRPSLMPSVRPSISPTSRPTNSPSKSTTSPSTAPSISPTVSSGAPSTSPTVSSATSRPSTTPSLSPSTSQPSTSPQISIVTGSPSAVPTTSPTCTRPQSMDIIWILDGSSSMITEPGEYESVDNYSYLKQFMEDFSQTVTMSPSDVRQGFVEFAGQQINYFSGAIVGRVIGEKLDLSDPAASDRAAFITELSSLTGLGGTTNTPAAVDYVRNEMLTPGNHRSGSLRVVILGSDGRPSWHNGVANQTMAEDTERAVRQLRDEDHVLFVFLRIGEDYPPNWFNQIADRIYEVASFEQLGVLLHGDFLCGLTERPTSSPVPRPSAAPIKVVPTVSPSTSRPSASPSSSPSRAPSRTPSAAPTSCVPGFVTCCFTINRVFLEFYVNEINLTPTVTPTSGWDTPSVTKQVTFMEPAGPAAIALKGLEDAEGSPPNAVAGLSISCVATRPGSAWNLVSRVNTGWRYIQSTDQHLDLVPSYWLQNDLPNSMSSGSTNYTGVDFALNPAPMCPSTSMVYTPRVRIPGANSKYFAFRRFVNQTCNGQTSVPTVATQAPSLSPSTMSPSESPSVTQTYAPSLTPSGSPSTSTPSITPTLSPSHQPTTTKPSVSPSRSTPTTSPSLAPTHSLSSSPSSSPSTSVPSAIPTISPTSGETLVPSGTPSTSVPSSTPTLGETSTPSGLPSQAPSTSLPSPTSSPSRAPISSAPSSMPTTLPFTNVPSVSPTGTGMPSQAPTACSPGVVTCCFTVDNALMELYVNGVNLTPDVLPGSESFNQATVAKTVTFTEPSDTAVIAIKGHRTNILTHAALALKCTCSRSGSPWTFVSSMSDNWYNVLALGTTLNTFPAGWYSNTYGGARSTPTLSTRTAFALNTETCGPIDPSNKLRAPTNNNYFTFLKNVTQDIPCGTGSPTLPITEKPTGSPTVTLTNAPSLSPSKAPSTSQPSFAPSVPTKMPSWSPTASPTICIPGNVTCCVTMDQQIVSLYINDVEVTSMLEPSAGLSIPAITKTITFAEPSKPAVIAFKGHAANEFQLPTLAIKCVATRAASSWNFASTLDGEWHNVVSSSRDGDAFPSNWYSINYAGPLTTPSFSTGTPIALSGETCGNVNPSDKLKATGPNKFYTFRRLVEQRCDSYVENEDNVVPPVNQNDLDVFNAIRSAFNANEWPDCNGDDPCTACSSNNEQHAIVCEEISGAVSSVRRRLENSERRIVVLRLRNMNLRGEVPTTELKKLTAAREINFGNDEGTATPNILTLPYSVTCLDIPRCSAEEVECDFAELPLCSPPGSAREKPSQSNAPNVALIGGIIVALVFLIAIVAFLVMRSRKRASKEPQPRQDIVALAVSEPPEGEDTELTKRPESTRSIRRTLTRSLSRKQSASSPWKELIDEETGARYWVNTVTGEFSWSSPFMDDATTDPSATLPTDVDGSQAIPIFSAMSHNRRSRSATSVKSVKLEAEQWRRAEDEEGHQYWVNTSTGQFVYDNSAIEQPVAPISKTPKKTAWNELFAPSGAVQTWTPPSPGPSPSPEKDVEHTHDIEENK